ncbi:DNA-binding protein [Rodentibacter haemolyticus]|uniref:Single-stranded DNA-binding protein n=1 Tax=Rodentibacter haemolyticus TaxID=2778911 RepID=A0ABX6UXJ3_9PAST|nr:DNA-binding protein [Rodentibacter haemolyticus]QPB42577.1 single-stranded DNA-binding protein [Rodentibacter haemolyticus]
MEHGIIVRGTFLGYKSSEYTNRETGEVRYRHVMGLGVSMINEFGSKSEDVQKISISQNDFNQGLINQMNELKLKDVEIHVNISAWEVGYTRTLV